MEDCHGDSSSIPAKKVLIDADFNLLVKVLTVYSVNRGKATAAKSQIEHTLFSEDTPFPYKNRTQAYSANGTSSAPIRSRTSYYRVVCRNYVRKLRVNLYLGMN